MPDDAPAIAQVHVASWRAAYPDIVPAEVLAALDEQEFEARWQSRLAERPPLLILVAERQGQVCGFASGGAVREGVPPYDAELYALYLLPSAQRQGIGRALFARVADALHKEGREHLLLWAFRENAAAGFYRTLAACP